MLLTYLLRLNGITAESSTNRKSDRGSHADEAAVWDDPQQWTNPTVHPTARSESDAICNENTHHLLF